MLKLLYAGLVAVFTGALIFVGARAGLFSNTNHAGLTADLQLASEIPINKTTNDGQLATKPTTKQVDNGEKPPAKPVVAKIVTPAPVVSPTPAFAPVSPTKVVLPVPEPQPASESASASQPIPEPTPAPEPIPPPIPEPPPITAPVPVPEPVPVPAPTLESSPEPIRVEIYAIQTGTTAVGSKDEFVKLYNPTNSDIDLAGWVLDEVSSTGSSSHLVSSGAFTGKIVAHGYFVVANAAYQGSHDLLYSANSNDLSYTNNAAVLYASNGLVMDSVSWTDLPKDTIWTRP